MDFEQPIGDTDAEIRVDLDRAAGQGGMHAGT
jgi:hypothetical protein